MLNYLILEFENLSVELQLASEMSTESSERMKCRTKKIDTERTIMKLACAHPLSNEWYISLYIDIGEISFSHYLSLVATTITGKKERNCGIKQPTNSFVSYFKGNVMPGVSFIATSVR